MIDQASERNESLSLVSRHQEGMAPLLWWPAINRAT